jgi:hypothetical protein
MARKPTPGELNFKARSLAAHSDLIARIVCSAIHGGVWVFCVYLITSAARDFAGKETRAEFFLKAIADLKANQGFAYLFGAGGIIYGLKERRSRKKIVGKVQERNRTLEKMLDPGRSSSGLPQSGDTRKGDSP